MKNVKLICAIISLLTVSVFANGLMVPNDENYPYDFLRNRSTEVSVNIHGIIAETIVTQEFIHEGQTATDAVYSFPLPDNARANRFLYWKNDNVYTAVLKVKEQAVNPGTGEGGVIALVNDYIGRNGIKIQLKDIQPNDIQKVQLHYVSLCDYYAGTCTYTFPLNTADFNTYASEHTQFTMNVDSDAPITNYDLTTPPILNKKVEETNRVWVEGVFPKSYQNQDFHFTYTADVSELGVNFYSAANDSMDGHFVLVAQPQSTAEADSTFAKNVIFVLSNSSNMVGYKLTQSIKAVETMLDELTDKDTFNILVFNNNVQRWQNKPVKGSSSNINSAKTFLGTISSSWGTDMQEALETALNQITSDDVSNSILIFTDGRSPLDPRDLEQKNTHKTGIFPIAVGDDVSRERLEMTAALNYGFVTFINENDNLYEKALQVFTQTSQPLLKDMAFEFGGAPIHDVLPEKIPTTYTGSCFYLTGRYTTAATASLAVAGYSVKGVTSMNFALDFTDDINKNKFAEYMWAKQKMDALAQEIEIYGETAALKQELIDLSLTYNIRCRYTAYIADYETEYESTLVEHNALVQIPESHLLGNYPNPFNPTTTISFVLSEDALTAGAKFIKIYNSLGQLVFVFDITHYQPGSHTIQFQAVDFWGNPLSSGTYFARLIVGNQTSTIRLLLVK